MIVLTGFGQEVSWLKTYDVAWDRPGGKALHSMPAGGGNIALNVWTTADELLLYLGSPDSWIDGKSPGEVQNVKQGRLRVRIVPNPFEVGFRQEQDLATNSVVVSGAAVDGTEVSLRIWVDVFNPVVHIEGDAAKPVTATVQAEIWRGDARFEGNSVTWYHRNEGPSAAREASIARHGIQEIASLVPDPVGNLTFGGRLSGEGMIPDGPLSGEHEGMPFKGWRLKTAQASNGLNVQATLRISQDPTLKDWENALTELATRTRSTTGADWKRTSDWWREFWNRSHIVINPGKPSGDQAWQVGRNYQLFRAMLASNRSGKLPTLFNGGSFLCEKNPDQRQWSEAGFTAQNQRLIYWPLLKTGDTDVLKVALDFYARRLSLERGWAKLGTHSQRKQ